MGDSVTIVGCYPQLSRIVGEVWVMNDWYMREALSHLEPDRIFQLHWSWMKVRNPGRFEGDWKRVCRDTKALVTTLDELEDLPSELLDIKMMTKCFKSEDLSNSLAIIIGVAILDGYRYIKVTGAHLLGAEFIYEIHGVLNMIDRARSQGIKVEADFESQWRENKKKINWEEIEFSSLPYWKRDKRVGEKDVTN